MICAEEGRAISSITFGSVSLGPILLLSDLSVSCQYHTSKGHTVVPTRTSALVGGVSDLAGGVSDRARQHRRDLVLGFGFRVKGLGFRVWGIEYRV